MAKINTEDRKNMPKDEFALANGPGGKPMFPLYDNGILSKRHIRLAWDMLDRAKGLSAEQRSEAKGKILKAAKAAHIDTDAWTKTIGTGDAMEVTFGQVEVLDSAAAEENKPMRVRLRGTRVNVVNDNNRLYPLDVMTDAVERFNARIASGRAVGESPHPKALRGVNGEVVFDTQASNSVWKHLGASIDQDGWINTDVEIIPTSKGRDVAANIAAGVPVGDSIRAVGRWTTRQISGRTVSVPMFLEIHAFDCVMNEATPGSQVVAVLDSLEPITDSKMHEIWADGPPVEEEDESLKFAVLMPFEAITDSIQFRDKPIDPSSGEELQPQDPDGDGDVDFYTNANGEVFLTDRSMTHETHAHQYLRKMAPTDDGDNYSLARQWQRNQKPAPATDNTHTTAAATDAVATKGDEDELKLEDLLKSPEFLSAVDARAREIVQPALDSVTTQTQEREVAEAKKAAEAHVTERLTGMKDKLSETQMTAVTDSIKGKYTTTEQADVLLDTALELISVNGANHILSGFGATGQLSNAPTATRVEVTNEPKPWQPIVDSLVAGFDAYGEELGHTVDHGLRKYNKKTIDKVLDKFEKSVGMKAFQDSKAFMDSAEQGTLDAVSTTTSQLLNQPTILEAVIVQAFQDVESLQFLMVDVFDGTEWRIPVETFTEATSFNTATAMIDILVPEGQGITESNTNLGWLSFSPSWRRNAFSITEDAVRGLLTGPAKYPAVSRAIYHLGYAKRRRLDDAAYYEMILASDEYLPKVVANEAASAANVVAGAAGTNVAYQYQLQVLGGTTFPIVRPRTKNEISANGQIVQVTSNAFTLSVNDGTTQVMGYLDADGNIQGPTGVTYAVDFENGVLYFNAASGVSPGATTPVVPTVSYSAATNYDTWHYSQPTSGSEATIPIEQYYNTLLQKITTNVAKMSSAPRFKKPNLAVMSNNVGAYIENAAMWYKLQQPDGSEFMPNTETFFGRRSGVNFARINAPWVAGDGRMLLTQRGATRYGIQTPYAMEGPFQKYDVTTGNVIDAKLWYGKENSVLATPQVTDGSGNILNPVARTIRIVS